MASVKAKKHSSLVKEAEIFYEPNYCSEEVSNYLFKLLNDDTKFERHTLYFHNNGKIHQTKSWRQSYWFGDYPQATQQCGKKVPTDFVKNYPFPPEILKLKKRLEKDFDVKFNSCLVGKFDSPGDKIGYHSDASFNMGPDPHIGSVSFGLHRKFLVKNRVGDEKISVLLRHGDALIMRKNANKKYLHSVPKQGICNKLNPRINVTFRMYEYHYDEIIKGMELEKKRQCEKKSESADKEIKKFVENVAK